MPVVRQLYDSFMTFQTGYGCGEMVKEKWAAEIGRKNGQRKCAGVLLQTTYDDGNADLAGRFSSGIPLIRCMIGKKAVVVKKARILDTMPEDTDASRESQSD